MSARHLNHRIALLALRTEISETYTQVKAHPLTQAHVATYATQLSQWDTVFAQELALRDGITAAKARMSWIDVKLDSLAGRVSKELLTLTGDDRSKPLYVAYFAKKTLGDFRRPQLAAQLEAMRSWIPQLEESGVPALVALGVEVAAAVEEADNAVKAHSSLEQQLAYFREAGDRKKFFDQVNAVRKETYGELGKLPYEHPALPSNFADRFFLHREADEEEVETLGSVKAEVSDLSQKLAKRQARLAELESNETAKKAAETQAKKALVEQLEKEAAAAEEQLQAMRAKIAELNQ